MHKRAIGLNDDVVLLAVLHDFSLLVEWVEL
jgi:hypothetical protein